MIVKGEIFFISITLMVSHSFCRAHAYQGKRQLKHLLKTKMTFNSQAHDEIDFHAVCEQMFIALRGANIELAWRT